MSIHIICGPSDPARSHRLIDQCLERMRSSRPRSFLYLVPTERRVRAVQDAFLDRLESGGLIPHLHTLNSFVRFLHQQLGGWEAPISDSMKSVLIESIVLQRAAEFEPFFAPHQPRPFPGLIRRLATFIAVMKRQLLLPAALADQLHDEPAQLLTKVYRGYQELLTERQLTDMEGVFWLVRERLPGRGPDALAGIDLLVLDGFYDVTRVEGEILDQVSGIVPETRLSLDYHPSIPALRWAEPFLQHWPVEPAVEEVSPAGRTFPVRAIENDLFAEAPEGNEPEVERIACREYSDARAEVRGIAASLKRLAGEGGPLRKFAVCFPDLSRYAPLVAEIFPAHGIPYQLGRGEPLLASPVVVSLMRMLAVVSTSYRRDAVFDFFASPYIRFRGRDGSLLEIADLDAAAREAEIVGGKERWSEALQRTADRRRQDADRQEKDTWDPETDEAALASPAELRARAERIDRTRGLLTEAFELLSSLESEQTPTAFRDAITTLIDRFDVQPRILAEGVSDDIRRIEMRALIRLEEVLAEVAQARELVAGPAGANTLPLTEFGELLRMALRESRISAPAPPDAVEVLDPHTLRGGEFDFVFLGGLTEKSFPAGVREDAFLPDATCARLGLPTAPDRLAADRMLFALCLGTARRNLFLSVPQMEGKAPVVPSPFFEDLARRAGKADEPDPGREFFTARDVHLWLGEACGAEAPTSDAETYLSAAAALAPDELPALGNLIHNVEVQQARTDLRRLSPWEGMLETADLSKRFGPRYSFTAHTLEMYARCPFRFFAEKALGVAPLREVEEFGALERGRLIHRILTRAFRQLRDDKVFLHREKASLEEGWQVLEQISREEFARAGAGLIEEVELERAVGSEQRPGLLRRLLELEWQESGRARPSFFEMSFGFAPGAYGESEALPPLELPRGGKTRVRIVGRIDRIDASEADGVFLIVDYKTGKAPPPRDLVRGTHLQMPLYVLAADRRLRNWRAVGACFISLADLESVGKEPALLNKAGATDLVGFSSRKKMVLDERGFEAFLAETEERVLACVEEIRAGRFPPSKLGPHQAGCTYCPYRDVCRQDLFKMSNLPESTDELD